MRKIIVTGGAGFIGSHVVEYFSNKYPTSTIVVLDKMTYAADFRNLSSQILSGRVRLVVGDLCDFDLCQYHVKSADLVIHLAAESHVDNSFVRSRLFTQTNVLGTHTLMEACRQAGNPRIIHVSTDEVYGEVLCENCDEQRDLRPTNPYSASKAAADMVVLGYIRSFRLPVVIVRSNNIYGTRQFPEKLIPCCCMALVLNKKIPVHGDGSNLRHYLSVHDFAEALHVLTTSGKCGEIYNVASSDEKQNLQIAEMICEAFGKSTRDAVEFVPDRRFNDRRYSLTCEKIKALGWRQQKTLKGELPTVVQWYKDNAFRYTDDPHREASARGWNEA